MWVQTACSAPNTPRGTESLPVLCLIRLSEPLISPSHCSSISCTIQMRLVLRAQFLCVHERTHRMPVHLGKVKRRWERGGNKSNAIKQGVTAKYLKQRAFPWASSPSMLRTFPPSAASSVRLDIYLSAALNRWQEAQVSVQLFLTLGEVECQRLGLNQCNLSFKQDEWRKYEWLLRKMFGKWL